MTVFRQLGDPLAGAVCLCQHHGAAYAEMAEATLYSPDNPLYTEFDNGAVVVSTPITTTERCCIAVTSAILIDNGTLAAHFEIERPLATIRTAQEDDVISGDLNLIHHGAWEALDPGTYTYYIVNRSGVAKRVYAAWIKAIASDCEA